VHEDPKVGGSVISCGHYCSRAPRCFKRSFSCCTGGRHLSSHHNKTVWWSTKRKNLAFWFVVEESRLSMKTELVFPYYHTMPGSQRCWFKKLTAGVTREWLQLF
ncbi:hypothetical protein GOODEAATRI_033994, partial [Goodea atripinnis]